jgi:hypothetical protein
MKEPNNLRVTHMLKSVLQHQIEHLIQLYG